MNSSSNSDCDPDSDPDSEDSSHLAGDAAFAMSLLHPGSEAQLVSRTGQSPPGPCSSGTCRCHGENRMCSVSPSAVPAVRCRGRHGRSLFLCSVGISCTVPSQRQPFLPDPSSFLAPGTIIGTPIPLAQAPDSGTTTPTLPAFAPEDAEATLVTARRTVRGHEVRECRPTIPDRSPQDFPDRPHKGSDLFPAQPVAAPRRVYFCTKQRFADIDVSKAGDPTLVQQKGLDIAPAPGDQRP